MNIEPEVWRKMADESLEQLKELCPPPDEPRADPTLLQICQSKLGITLPQEYKKLFMTFGVGDFVSAEGGVLEFFTVLSLVKSKSYLAQIKHFAKNVYSLHHDDDPEFCPYGGFPEREPGMLSFAQLSGDQENLMWGGVRTGESNPQWPIYAFLARSTSEPFDRFDLPVTTFITRLINGQIKGNHIRSDRVKMKFTFDNTKPWDDGSEGPEYWPEPVKVLDYLEP